MLSDIVGERIKLWRKRRGWTRERLGQECARIGLSHLSEAVITNIESGRLTSAKRRRMVTIDEFVAIAFVLDVPPSALVSTYPESSETELFPGEEIAAHAPLLWFAGRRLPYHSTDDYSTLEPAHQFIEAAEPVELVLRHDKLLEERAKNGRYYREFANSEPDSLVEQQIGYYREEFKEGMYSDETLREILRVNLLTQIEKNDFNLIQLREGFEQRGYPLPSLPPALKYLEGQRSESYQRYVSHDGDPFTPEARARQNAYARLILRSEEQ